MRSKTVIYIALVSDMLIAVTKFIVATITRSSAMASEGVHSVIDCISQLLLLWGIRKSKQKADEMRPFGYGRELYFWSFIVSLTMFSMGGCISLYEGIARFRKHTALSHLGWNYLVLAIGAVFTIISGSASLKVFNKQRGDISFWKAIRQSKDPAIFIVLLGDMGDLAGLFVAFIGIYIAHLFNNPSYDAIASIIIGALLISISLILVRESRSLLLGEAPSKKILRNILDIVEADVTVIKVKDHFSTYLAPDDVILQLITVFKDDLNTQQITEAIERIIKTIQEKYPRIKQIFIEPHRK